jgi:hypothetical protein
LPETQGAESYPSQDKAVLFFEVADLAALLDTIGKDKIVHCGRTGSTRRLGTNHNVLEVKKRNLGLNQGM